MKKNHTRMGMIVLSIILLAVVGIPVKSYTSKLLYKMNHFLPENLYVNHIHLGGKTLEEAKEELNKLEAKQLKKHITILCDDGKGYYQSNDFRYEELGYYAAMELVDEQLNIIMNQDISLYKRFINYRKIQKSGLDIKLKYSIHYDKFLKALEVFDDSKLKPPVDASYRVSNGKVEIIPEEQGYVFNKDELHNVLLANENLETAKLNVKAIKPNITAELLKSQGVKELISKFTTRYDSGNKPRSNNIKLAAEIIDRTIVPPGSTFSFNDVVGDRTEERGFQEAGVYINGKVDTGIGGGICQVSTTLYNAVLLADLAVVERSNHSLTVPYVPLSRDAAVSWGAQDFKFTNNTEYHILVHCTTGGGAISFELYSTKNNRKVELVSTTLSKSSAPVTYIDDAIALIGYETVVEKGHDGYQSQLVKKVYIDNKEISSEVISRDKYLPAAKIIKRGTRLPEALKNLDEGI